MPMLNKSLQKDNIGFYMITHKSTNHSFQLFLIPGFYSVFTIFVCIYVILSIFTCLLVFLYYCSSKNFGISTKYIYIVIRQRIDESGILTKCVSKWNWLTLLF